MTIKNISYRFSSHNLELVFEVESEEVLIVIDGASISDAFSESDDWKGLFTKNAENITALVGVFVAKEFSENRLKAGRYLLDSINFNNLMNQLPK